MKSTTIIIIVIITALILMLSAIDLFAQPSLPTSPSQAPIDGGLGLLAAAGGTYALKKLRDRKKMDDDSV